MKREFAMTTFVNNNPITNHTGANRVEAAIAGAGQIKRGFSGTRGLATLLLSAVVAAVMVVANQVMDSVAEGHLLVMWMALWISAFIALALFAAPARGLAQRVKTGLDTWSAGIAERRADDRLMAAAQADPRVMQDLQAAMSRVEADQPVGEVLAPHLIRLNARSKRLARMYTNQV
jgi:hypothetical protein